MAGAEESEDQDRRGAPTEEYVRGQTCPLEGIVASKRSPTQVIIVSAYIKARAAETGTMANKEKKGLVDVHKREPAVAGG